MNYQSTIFAILTITIFLFSNLQINAQCEDPFSLDLVKKFADSKCTESIYYFYHNGDWYVYVKKFDDYINADWSNTLYNCSKDSTCLVFGLTLPSAQCDEQLLRDIYPFLIEENIIFPKEKDCKPLPSLATEKGDVYIEESCYGVILTAPNTNCYRLRVSNDGDIISEPVRCPD